MAAIAFVLFWVLLGLGLLLLALRGGSRGAASGTRPRRSRRVGGLGFLLALLVLGVAVPAAVIATVNNRDSIPEANVSNLTAAEKHGRELFGHRCTQCHTLAASNAVAQVGPNLDTIRPPKVLVLDAIKNGRSKGNGQMAAGLYQGTDAEDVAAYVAKAVGQTGQGQ